MGPKAFLKSYLRFDVKQTNSSDNAKNMLNKTQPSQSFGSDEIKNKEDDDVSFFTKRCAICDANCGMRNWLQHIQGKRHRFNIAVSVMHKQSYRASDCLLCRVGLVVSLSASHTVGGRFASRLGHTKDHHTNCLPA